MVYGIPSHRLQRGRGRIAPLTVQEAAPAPEAAPPAAPAPEPVAAKPVPAPEPPKAAKPEPAPEPPKAVEPEPLPEPELPDPYTLTAASPKADVIAVAKSLGIPDTDKHSKKELLAHIKAKLDGN